jgi:hypothetical protein
MIEIPPPDDLAHQDGVFLAEVTALNATLGRYVLHVLDVDAGHAAPLDVANERALADQVTSVAAGLRARAARRQLGEAPPPLLGPSRHPFCQPASANGVTDDNLPRG